LQRIKIKQRLLDKICKGRKQASKREAEKKRNCMKDVAVDEESALPIIGTACTVLRTEPRLLDSVCNDDSFSRNHFSSHLVPVEILYKPLPFRLSFVFYSVLSDLFLN
jgi:hypothetical protein